MVRWMRVLVAKLHGLFDQERLGTELQEEIQLHVQLLTDKYIRQGVEPQEALAMARRQFGNSTVLREHHYTQSSFSFLSTLTRDLRFGARQLRRNLVLTAVAVASLALGIGANTAIFTTAKYVMFDRLPVKEPLQLRLLTWVSGHEQPVPPVWGDVASNEDGGLTSNAFSYPVFEELRKRSDAVQDVMAFKDVSFTATIDGHAEMIEGEMISGGSFNSLGVLPELGRMLSPSDDAGPGVGPAAVISDAYWAQKFARSPSALGQSISLNGVPVTIVGVIRGKFSGLQMGSPRQIFVPLTLQPLIMPRAQNGSTSLLSNPQSWWVQILVRIRPDVSEIRAQAELDTTLRQTALPVLSQTKDLARFHLKMQPGDRGLDYLRGRYARQFYALLALSGLVLLLACINLANLLLARSACRQHEIKTRLALGAGRGSILRQILTESVLLSSLGGLAGLLVGYLGHSTIPRLLEGTSQLDLSQAAFDWKVLLFTFSIALATGIFFGLAPAYKAIQLSAGTGLRDAGGVTASRHRLWLDKSLVVGQIAISAILLMGAGLFVRTLVNLNHVPLGFESDHILLFHLNPPRARYTNSQMIILYQQLEQKLADMPGTKSVTMSNIAIIGDGHSGASFSITGRLSDGNPQRVQTNGVGTDFFKTLGIPILQGRAFNARDTASSPKVAIINRALAHRFFPNQNPVGQIFETDAEDIKEPIQIVGVASDTRYADLRGETPPTFYVPYQQRLIASRMVVELRTTASPGSMLAQARAAVESLDKDLPLTEVRSMKEQVRSTLADERSLAQLSAEFSMIALILACIGIYGIMAYTVNARTGEIGLRMALGAHTNQILSLVLREAFCLAAGGIAFGLFAGLWLMHLIRSMLYGVETADIITMTGTGLLLILVSLFAAFAPARRAARIDPIHALRNE